MKLTIFGSGYVGLVTGACLAEMGNHVVCVDVDPGKIALLNSGGVPIHEPGLDELIASNMAKGRLKFTTDAKAGVDHGLFQFIAVGTPPDEDGSADLRYVVDVATAIGKQLERYTVVVNKSTVQRMRSHFLHRRFKAHPLHTHAAHESPRIKETHF